MGYKKVLKKIARFILSSQPETFTSVEVAQINYGETLKGKKVIITGGGSGLGLAMAKKFVHEGATVMISGRRKEVLERAAKELGASYLQFDVSDVSEAGAFLRQAKAQMGGLDCLVCNAGISLHEGNIANVTPEDFDKQFNTNFRGSYFLAKEFLELKSSSENVEGNLLFITSETGDQCYDIPYGLTKAALNSLVGALSRRVYRAGIRVNAVAPGVTLTDMTKDYAQFNNGNMYRECASGRTFLPEEVAEVACFLLSDASKCISGEVIHCNAGNHLKAFWDNSQ